MMFTGLLAKYPNIMASAVTNNAKMIACIKLEESIVTLSIIYKACPPTIGLVQ